MNVAEARQMAADAPHWEYLEAFVVLEDAVGGPDPHLATLGKMIEDETWEEQVWRTGCYASGYNLPMGEVIWQEWPWPTALERPEKLDSWIHENWKGFKLRKERRAVRTPLKFSRCLRSYAEWMAAEGLSASWWRGKDSYDEAWRAAGRIYGMGRYVNLKLLEAWRRYCGAEFITPDIRASGGESPRATLAILFPEYAEGLLGGDTAKNIRLAEDCASAVRYEVNKRAGIKLDYFRLQVILCETRKVYERKQYPGRTHDTEIDYHRHMQQWFKNTSTMFQAREAIFPHVALGEKQGWNGKRVELEPVLAEHGYQWSDLLYDYKASSDLAKPVERSEQGPFTPAMERWMRRALAPNYTRVEVLV